jgi:hypothetical protein
MRTITGQASKEWLRSSTNNEIGTKPSRKMIKTGNPKKERYNIVSV